MTKDKPSEFFVPITTISISFGLSELFYSNFLRKNVKGYASSSLDTAPYSYGNEVPVVERSRDNVQNRNWCKPQVRD